MPITNRISRPIKAEPEATQLKQKLGCPDGCDLVVEGFTNGTRNLLCLSVYRREAKAAPLPQVYGNEPSRLATRPIDLEQGLLGFDYDETATYVSPSEIDVIRSALKGKRGFRASDPTPLDQYETARMASIINRLL